MISYFVDIRKSFRIGVLLTLFLSLLTVTAFAYTVYPDPNYPCWSADVHCPGGYPTLRYCTSSYPNYCPNAWSYEVTEDVSVTSGSVALSTNISAPTLAPVSGSIIVNADASGAYYDPYQYEVWIHYYDLINNDWLPWSVWTSWTTYDSFSWELPQQPGFYSMQVNVRSNYVNGADVQSPIYYFSTYDSAQMGSDYSISPQFSQVENQPVQFYAQGAGAPLNDYIYKFGLHTCSGSNVISDQILFETSYLAPWWTYTWTAPSYVEGRTYGLYVQVGTLSKKQAYGGVFKWDVQMGGGCGYEITHPLLIDTSPLPNAKTNIPYSAAVNVSGGLPPYYFSWILDVGSVMPPWLNLDSYGVFSGTPPSEGQVSLLVKVEDSSSPKLSDIKMVGFDIVAPLTITTSATPATGLVNTPFYNNTLHATGGVGAYTWSIIAGSIPPGVTMSGAGVFTGTPTATGTYNFTVRVTDEQNPPDSASRAYTIIINAPIYINTSVLPDGQYSKPYSQYLSASNGTGTYTWSYQSGTIPPGLTLSSSGLISGTPTANGDYSFTVMAVDGINVPAVRQISLKIVYAPISITTAATLPSGNSGVGYSKFITATGGDGTYSWSKTTGTLPPGISLNTATGELYGSPTSGGNFQFDVTVSDGVNPSATRTFYLTVNAPPSITTTTINSGQYGISYSYGISASGGSNTFSWSLLAAPSGFVIDADTGVISGIPMDIGQLQITVQVADKQNLSATATKILTFIVKNSPSQNSQNASVVGCEASSLVCTNSSTDIISGIVNHDQELFTTKGGMQNIAINLFYKSLPGYNGSLGIGWSHNYDIFLTIYSTGDGSIVLNTGSGDKHYYTKNGSNYDSTAGDTSVLTAVSGGYKITFRDGSSYNFNSSGKITSLADRFGNVISFTYTGNDLTGITDPSWKTSTFAYEQSTTPHRINTITDPYGNVYTFTYQGSNLYRVTNPAATTGAAQGYWEYQYNAAGLLQSKLDPNGYISSYSYYSDKRMQTATDPNGRTRTIVYPPLTGTLRTSTLTEKDSGQWLYTYDSSTGAIKQKTDPNGKATDFYYYTSGTSNGFIKAKTEPKDGATRITTFYSYDSYGNLLIETEPADLNSYSPAIDPNAVTDITTLTSKSPPIKAARHYIYDNAAGHYDRITSVADERGTTTRNTSFAYTTDGYGEVITATTTPGNYVTITRKNTNGTVRQLVDANGKITSFTYRPYNDIYRNYGTVGLLEKIIAPDNTSTLISSYDKGKPYLTEFLNDAGTSTLSTYTLYDNLGRLTNRVKYSSTLGGFSAYTTFDLAGNLKSITDAELHETKYQYNYNRQVTKITDAKLNDTIFKYSSSEQNGIDQLVGVYDANVAKHTPLDSQPHTAYIYDDLGRLESETDPLGKKIYYTYYDNGQLKEKYDATSATPGTLLVTFTYNNRGQILDKTFTDGTSEHYTYTANGQLLTAYNQNISYTYAYYTDGRLQSVTDTTNSRQIYYDQYDSLGQRKQVTILKEAGVDQRIINYDYDSANRPWHIASTAGQFTYGYDTSGRRQTVTYPNPTPNLLTANYVYDDLSRLISLTHKNGTTPFATFNYTLFDKVGNRKAVTGSKNETYGYDELYRLTNVTATKSEAYTYDPAGNRLTGSGASDSAYQSNAANQMTQGRKLTYDYDNQGNQANKTVPGATDKTWARTWDLNNRLTKEEKVKGTEVKTVTYKYDPFGRRIEKKFVQTKSGETETETTNYVYDNEDIVVEYFTTSVGTEKTFYTHGHGIDEPLAMERSGSYYYFHADGLGSITHITNSDKTAVQSYTYDAYGMATASSDFRNSYQYAGYIWDWETGTYHVRERTYDPMTGIWTSKDPIGMAGGDINLYRYVEGQPINFVDPSGLSRIDPGGLLERPFAGGGGISSGAGNLAARSGGSASVPSRSVSQCTQPYTRSSLKLGQEKHKAYRADDVIPNVAIKEYKLPSGKRIDFIDFPQKTIFELKPNNPRGFASGSKQLEKYLLEVESNYGQGWSTILELY